MRRRLKPTGKMRPRTGPALAPVVSLVSLGCAKNTVDSECILGNLVKAGLLIAEDPARSDVCLVNTCGFIRDARDEAEQVLAELAKRRAEGRPKAIVALGCLVEHVANCPEMAACIEKADAWVGFRDYARLPEICRRLASVREIPPPRADEPHIASYRVPADFMRFLGSPRLRIGTPHSAYLKISEGCSNLCRFCSIPRIRGRQVSRPLDELVAEARTLVDSGAREINLIAQDTTSYGADLYGERRLAELLRRLAALDRSVWVRLLYAHPRFLDSAALDVLASEENVCPYVDLPLQHISDAMLSAMGRGMSRDETLHLLDRIRQRLPHGALRTTFIAGYPGETEEHFRELLDFVREGRFRHVGVFLYSHEPATPAARLADDIPPAVKEQRREALMLAQLDVSRALLRKRVGEVVEVLVDSATDAGEGPAGTFARGRTKLEAPEVDGEVYLRGQPPDGLAPGWLTQARVQESLDYDLIAEALP